MKRKNKSSFLYATFLIMTAFLIVVAVFLLTQNNQSSYIALPEQQQEISDNATTSDAEQNHLLQVTVDNVLSVVGTLHRPLSYVQSFSVFYNGNTEPTKTVTLVSANGKFRAESNTDHGTSTIISDGVSAWTWHSTDFNPVQIMLNRSVTTDDLIGIPTYESLLTTPTEAVIKADYIVLPETNDQCIYVATHEENVVTEYWIGIDSGLLLQACVVVNDETIYTSYQESLEVLTPDHEILQQSFMLPDGSLLYSEE